MSLNSILDNKNNNKKKKCIHDTEMKRKTKKEIDCLLCRKVMRLKVRKNFSFLYVLGAGK